MIYKYTALTTFQPKKAYLALKESDCEKQRYCNHSQSFRNENYSNSLTLSSYVWKIKKLKKETTTLMWEKIRTAAPYTNITNQCSLCFHENLAIIRYPIQNELLSKRSELVLKCRYKNKFLLETFNTNN